MSFSGFGGILISTAFCAHSAAFAIELPPTGEFVPCAQQVVIPLIKQRPGVRSVSTESVPIRTGRTTHTFKTTFIDDRGRALPASRKTPIEGVAGGPEALSNEFEMLEKVRESAGADAVLFPQAVQYVPGQQVVVAWIEGETLADTVEKHGCTQEQYSSWERQLDNLVEVLNRLEIAHGDLNPTNLVVTPDGGLRLIDFGIAVPFGETHVSSGTIGYNSPWQKALSKAQARDNNYGMRATLGFLHAHCEGEAGKAP